MTTATKGPRLDDRQAIIDTWHALIAPGQVTELRALDAQRAGDYRPGVLTGYFNDAETLAEAAATIKTAKGVYVVPNPINVALLARAANRLKQAGKGDSTQDSDIIGRRWLLVDADPVRPAGISSSDAEHAAALDRIAAVVDELHYNYGWPLPIVADSGNGAHALYRVDLPADDGGLVQRCLEALAARFDDAAVKIDKAVFNPARIWRLYGTMACKGDSTTARPWRMARILDLPDLQPVPLGLLEVLADEAPRPQATGPRGYEGNGHAREPFDLEAFIRRHGLDVQGPTAWNGRQGAGRRWTFNSCPMCEHGGDGPHILEHGSGAITAGCHHARCSWTWQDLRARFEHRPASGNGQPTGDTSTAAKPQADAQAEIVAVTLPDLIYDYPEMRPPVIAGLLRQGETGNLIHSPKGGKSWLAHALAFSVASGRQWLDTFPCTQGRVLLLDAELHAEVLASRLKTVAGAMNAWDALDQIDVVALRGHGLDLYGLGKFIDSTEPGRYALVVADAWYRFLPRGLSENDNSQVMSLYNLIDGYANHLEACWLNIHHASKGNQAEKSITDVGSGAGSQSRAADAHLILRPHELDGVAVLEAAVRSWPPAAPVCIRWNFPLWELAPDADPGRIRGPQLAKALAAKEQKAARLEEDRKAIVAAMRKAAGPVTKTDARTKSGVNNPRFGYAWASLEADGTVADGGLIPKGKGQGYPAFRLRETEHREHRETPGENTGRNPLPETGTPGEKPL